MTTQNLSVAADPHFAAADIVTHFARRLTVAGSFAAAHHHGLEARPGLSVPDALHIMNDDIRTMLLTTVTLLGRLMFHDNLFGKLPFQSTLQRGLNIFPKMPLVAFDRQDVVATGRYDLLGDFFLTPHGVDGHQR